MCTGYNVGKFWKLWRRVPGTESSVSCLSAFISGSCGMTGHLGDQVGPLARGLGPDFLRSDAGDGPGCRVRVAPSRLPFTVSLGTLPAPSRPPGDPVHSVVSSGCRVTPLSLGFLSGFPHRSQSFLVSLAPAHPRPVSSQSSPLHDAIEVSQKNVIQRLAGISCAIQRGSPLPSVAI